MVEKVLATLGVDCLLINSPTNTFYFAGYNNPECTIAVYCDGVVYYTDERYTAEARAIIPSSFELQAVSCVNYERITADMRAHGVAAVAVEMAYLTHKDFLALAAALPEVRFVDCSSALADCRTVKTDAELDRIRRAAHANDVAVESLLGRVREGMTELEMAYLMHLEYIKAGGEGIAFDTICVFGDHTAYPHGHPTHRQLRRGDVVTIDFGTKVQGYCSDITRNFCFGRPTDDYVEAYGHVLEANRRGIAAGYDGVSAKALDAVSREYLAQVGLGQYFTHSLGHGVGIDIHEKPFLNTRSQDTITKGMVYTIEPGIYINGKYGIRIEDLLYMSEEGPVLLSRCNKNLILL